MHLYLPHSQSHSFRSQYSSLANDDRVYRFVKSGLIELLLRKSSARKAACVRFLMHMLQGINNDYGSCCLHDFTIKQMSVDIEIEPIATAEIFSPLL